MPIISEIENFLLKFKQQSSDDSQKPVEVIVSKDEGKFMVEIKGDKKGSSIKISLTSLKEIVSYIDEKTRFNNTHSIKPIHPDMLEPNQSSKSSRVLPMWNGNHEPYSASDNEAVSDAVGNVNDLISDISAGKNALYASQADLIMSGGILPVHE
jgi:hypothetical protein